MLYRLVITTDGRPGMLERAMASFSTFVRPKPVEVCIVDDSGDEHYHRYLEAWQQASARLGLAVRLMSHTKRLGFCRTVGDAWWAFAADARLPWVFWLEDDFEITRPLNLVDLAYVMQNEPQVAQMALVRNPVNSIEIAAGGVIESRAAEFHQRGMGTMAWLEHQCYWTTNPSLFRTSFAAKHEWHPGPECEGNFGFALRQANPDLTFGMWGTGEPWCHHDAIRVGTGY